MRRFPCGTQIEDAESGKLTRKHDVDAIDARTYDFAPLAAMQ